MSNQKIFKCMRKIIFCAVVAIATLTFVSCGKQETVKNQVVGDIYAEQVEGGFRLVKKYGEQYAPISETIFSEIQYDKTLDLVFAFKDKLFTLYTQDGDQRGGTYESYESGDVFQFKAAGSQEIMVYSKGFMIGSFKKGDFVIEKNFIFTKNPKGLWNLRDFNGEYLNDKAYEKIYIIDMKDDGSYDKLCYRDGVWSMTGSDGGIYDKASTDDAVREVKKKNPTEPVGVLD